jgi:hypothetical protein
VNIYNLENSRRGFALGVILIVIACFGLWITSVSWSMMNNRSQYQRLVKTKRAYYMARSGMEHLLLKLKVMQRQCPHTVRALEAAMESEKSQLFKVFTADVVMPADSAIVGDASRYNVTDFEVESVDLDSGRLTLRMGVTGVYEGYDNTISRLMRVSR